MITAKVDDCQPGWIDVWRLWRHCLCRFGWYPIFVAPLVTCACLLDLYSSTGCDFIRMNIGFTPANDVWADSQAQLGLFNFDSHELDKNKWKRSFNSGCRLYSTDFDSFFIASDQAWHVSQIMAYISGISSLVAVVTAWLLTITPLPASFLWPGILLPAVISAMITGAGKFLFFDTQICSEPLWFIDESSPPVAAQSCEIGESSVFGIASVAAYFVCTILICFRSPQKRVLDENFGKPNCSEPSGSTGTSHTGIYINYSDPERGETAVQQQASQSTAIGTQSRDPKLSDSQQTKKIKNCTPQIVEHGQHTRTTSDVTWSVAEQGSNNNHTVPPTFNGRIRTQNALSAPLTKQSPEEQQRPGENSIAQAEWNAYGRPIVVTINDIDQDETSKSLSFSDGSNTQSSSKSPGPINTLPPRHNGKSTIQQHSSTIQYPATSNNSSSRNDYDEDDVASRISKISFADTSASDEFSALGMQSYSTGLSAKSAPSVVSIPRGSRYTFSGASFGSSHSSRRKLRSKNHKQGAREDRNDIFSNDQHSTGSNSRFEGKREMVEYLPRLDEDSTTRSVEDHGDLINKCVRDLQKSFNGDGFQTM